MFQYWRRWPQKETQLRIFYPQQVGKIGKKPGQNLSGSVHNGQTNNCSGVRRQASVYSFFGYKHRTHSQYNYM